MFAGGRISTILQLADVAADYQFTSVGDADVAVHRLAVSLRVHPLFFFLLTSDGPGATLASLYVRLGFAPTLATAGGGYEAGAAWDWGVGLDVPLTDRDADRSLWLGAEYVRTAALDKGPLEGTPLHDVCLRVGYRFQGP